MARQRSVIYFHAYPHQVAGAQIVTVHLAAAVVASGWRAEVIVPGDGPFVEHARERGVQIRVVPAGKSLLVYGRRRGVMLAMRRVVATLVYWVRLWRHLREVDAVVHVNDHRGVLLGGVAARLAGRPVVWHAHSPLPSRVLNRACAVVATRVVAVSSDTRKGLLLSRRTTLGKVSVIHNGLIRSSLPSGRRSQVSGCPLIAVGARLHPDKGLDVLLEAAAALRAEYPGISVAVAGHIQDGYETYAERLHERCVELGIQDAVHFLGRVEDTDSLWASADVYVQPSRAEPFGLCLLEAMAVRTPVVASAVGGMREVVENGTNGLLCRPDDPADLASAVSRLLADRDLSARCIAGGHAAVQTKFSTCRLNRQFLSLYEGLAGGPRPRIVRMGNSVTLWTIQRNQLVEQQNSGRDLVCLTDADEWSHRLDALGIVTVEATLSRRPGPVDVLRWIVVALRLLPIRRAVVLHPHNVAHILGTRIVSSVLRRHLVVETFHNTYELLQPGWRSATLRLALRASRSRCRRALFISERYEELVRQHRLVPEDRTEVIRTGIDVAGFRERARTARPSSTVRAELGVAPDDELSIVVARLDPQKGHERYLAAAAQLRDRHPALHHILVGHGLDTVKLLARVQDLDLGDRVQVLGYRDDVPELITASDLLVLPSSHEGFGRCVVEALAAGVPVVATDCDGPRRILEGGRFGLLVGMAPDELAAGMAKVIEDPVLQAEMRRLGPTRAESFDETATARRVNEIYEELLLAG